MSNDDVEKIKQALATGRLSVLDPATGYQRSIHARCPVHGEASSVYRIEKSGEAIVRAVFRCPLCGRQFDAKPEDMFLQ